MGNETLQFFLTALTVLAAGLLAAVAAGERRNFPVPVLTGAVVLAALTLLGAAAACVMQFGRPQMIFAAFGNTGSALFRELTAWGLTVLSLAAYLVAVHRGAFERTCRALGTLSAFFGLALTVSVASACMMPWRAAWNTWTILLPTLGFAVLAGAFAFEALSDASKRAHPRSISWILAGALAAILLTALYLTVIGLDESSEPSAARVLRGDLAIPFWAGAALAGVAIPVLLRALFRKSALVPYAAACCVFFGSGTLSWVIRQLGSASWSFFAR